MAYTRRIKNVFILSVGAVGGHLEFEGPLGKFLDAHFKDCYFGMKSFEDGEAKASKTAIKYALSKARISFNDVDLCIGGDLSDQISTSSRVASEIPFAFLGVYNACASSLTSLTLSALLVDLDQNLNVLSFCSSNFATAERQFRYPIAYGIQKKETATMTVTGAGASIISSRPSKIRISAITLGNVWDVNWNDANDLGSPMAYGAYRTFKSHIENMHESPKDYDMILTGDLSQVGSKVFLDCLKSDNITLDNYNDCGCLIYDCEKQKVYAGGSGVACLPLVMYGYVINKIKNGELKRVLLIATGALFSPMSCFQKQNIPVVGHAIVLEGNL